MYDLPITGNGSLLKELEGARGGGHWGSVVWFFKWLGSLRKRNSTQCINILG